jgi:fatty-acyl-CoA synthase
MKKNGVYKNACLKESYWPADTSEALIEMSVGDMLRKVAAEVPDRHALVEGIPDASKRRRWTYSQLLNDAEIIASALLKKFEPGDRVVVWSPNIAEYALLQYGLAIAGMIMVTANPAYRKREIKHVLDTAKPSGMFVTNEHRGQKLLEIAWEVQERVPSLKDIISFSDFDDFMNSGEKSGTFPEVKPYDPAAIIWTSGTTGFPKGAMVHHMGLMTTNFYLAKRVGTLGGVNINPSPMFHNAACGHVVMSCLAGHGTHVLLHELDVPLVLELIEKEKGKVSTLLPTVLEKIFENPDLMKKYDLSSLKSVYTTTEKPILHLVEKLKEMGVVTTIMFGMTETHGVTHATFAEDFDEFIKDGEIKHCGQPLQNMEIKIVDPDSGDIVPLNTVGEVCNRGFHVFLGYYNNPEETAKTIRDGWLYTGDLAKMDEKGCVKPTGRLKDMVRRGGENIFSREIEILLEEHPKVELAAVLAVPDDYWGEEVAVAIVPKTLDDEMTGAKELYDYCLELISSFKAPKIWCFFAKDDLPFSTMGRVQKFKIRDLIVSGEIKTERTGSVRS